MKEEIVLGGGCFWCIEAIMKELNGVTDVESGYAGGDMEAPTYEQVSRGKSGHAEVVKVTFDSETISLHDILTIFFTLHDPTTLNRQGNDVGPQYRSIVLTTTPEQRHVVLDVMKEIEDSKIWADPLVTEVKDLDKFYSAEDYHQDYYENNASQPYCQIVIEPKVAKLRKLFVDKLKKS